MKAMYGGIAVMKAVYGGITVMKAVYGGITVTVSRAVLEIYLLRNTQLLTNRYIKAPFYYDSNLLVHETGPQQWTGCDLSGSSTPELKKMFTCQLCNYGN